MPRHLAMLPAACVLLGAVVAGRAQPAPDGWRETAPAPASEAPAADERSGAPLADRDAAPALEVDPGDLPAPGRSGEAPVALDDAYLIQQGDTLDVAAANGVLVNDLDPEGDDIIASSYSSPVHGTASMTTDGSFTYQPDSGYEGPDTFTYTIYDGTSYSETGTIHIDVLPAANRAPLPTADHYAVAAGETLVVDAEVGLLVNDLDLDGDQFIATSYSSPAHGTASLSTSGSFSYVPEPDFQGTDSFSYTIRDEHDAYSAAAGEVTITVTVPRNRAPVPQSDWYYTPAGQPLAVSAAEGVLRNDLDPDGDSFIATSYSAPDHGSASMVTNGSFTYEPDAGFEGTDLIAYTIRDDGDAYSTTAGELRILVGVYGDLPVGVLTPPTPDGFALQEPAPNPFNPRTEIAFRTGESGHVELRVLDLRGRTVATLVDEDRPAGEHAVVWNGRDTAGARVASGTYLAELRRGGKRAVQKLTLVK